MAGQAKQTRSGCSACYARWNAGYTRIILRIQGLLARINGSIGAAVSRRPVVFVVLSILAAIACGIGWITFRIESATDVLWVPQDSKAMKDKDWVKAAYPSGGGFAQFLASVPLSRQGQYGNNALQLAIFWEMFQVDTAVRGIVVNDGGQSYSWTQLCELNYDGVCKYSGPLNFWSMSFQTYLNSVNGSATDPTAGNRAALVLTVNQPRFPDNTAVSTLSILGGIVLSPLPNPPPGAPPLYMSSAQVVSQSYALRDGLDDNVLSKWYDQFLDILGTWSEQAQYTSFAYIAGNSVENEIGRSVTADLYLIVISVAIFVLVAVLGLSRWHPVATRSSLALLGVVSAVLAMVAAYGLALVFGCPFNTLSQCLPYVLLGLAVDCMFILVKAYDGTVENNPSLPLETRFRSLMSKAGASVVVTLLASAVAFALGAISELPAVVWFSVYATMGVVCILVATLTFFTGVFVLTERRIARNRVDCLCCVTSGGPPVPTAARVYSAAAGRSSSGRSSASFADGAGGAGGGGPGYVPTAVVIYPATWQGPAAVAAAPPLVSAPSRGGPVAESVEGAVGEGEQEQQLHLPNQPQREGSASASLSNSSSATQRQQAASKSAVPSVSVSDEKLVAAAAMAATPPSPLELQQPPAAVLKQTGAVQAEPNLMKKLFARYYAPALTRWWVKVIVVLVFIGWAVLTGVGIPKLKEGQPLSELAPDDSYLQDYVSVMQDTFQQQIGSPTELYFRWFSPATPQQQATMLQALGDTLDNTYINSTVSAFQGNWLLDFIGWVQTNHTEVQLVQLAGCSNPYIGRVSGDLGLFVNPDPINGCVPQDVFFPLLMEFLKGARGYMEDVRFNVKFTPNGSLVPYQVWSSRFPVVHTAQGDNYGYGRECIKSVRHLEDDINEGLFAADNARAPNYVFFMYNEDYIYDEGDAILGVMTMEYVLLAVAGVGVVLLLTLPSIRAVLLMMLSVGLVDFFLFGEMFILNIRFNQVSIINMIMATGLSVDYSVYFAQRFVAVTADGTRNGRMALALADTGSAVFVGGLTALAGTIPLAFSSSTILRTFFALIFGTIAFALLVGLMLMPVIFSLIGPPPLNQGVDEGDSGSHDAATAAEAAGVGENKGPGVKGAALAPAGMGPEVVAGVPVGLAPQRSLQGAEAV